MLLPCVFLSITKCCSRYDLIDCCLNVGKPSTFAEMTVRVHVGPCSVVFFTISSHIDRLVF